MEDVTEIIEIVFERVHLSKTVKLLFKMLSNSKLKDYCISTDSSEIDLQSKEKLFNSINQSSDGSFYFNFLDSDLIDVILARVGFQIYKYDNKYDLTLIIEEKEIRHQLSILGLQKRSESLALELKAVNYCCGYEPAEDEETRLFSGNVIGPISNWGSMDKQSKIS
jgi:hypothetical protein